MILVMYQLMSFALLFCERYLQRGRVGGKTIIRKQYCSAKFLTSGLNTEFAVVGTKY